MAALVFCRAIALRPDLPDAYFNLGTALVLQSRCALAKSPLCREGQAHALRAEGRSGEAETLLAEVRAVSAVSPETESRPAPLP